MDFSSVSISNIEGFLLVLTRTAGIFTLVPIFGDNHVPMQIRVGIALSLSLIFTPLALSSQSFPVALDVLPLTVMILKEAVTGIAIGFVTLLVFAAIQVAGEYIDLQSGFNAAQMMDPLFGSQTAIAGRFHQLLASVLFFVTNAHHIVLLGLADSFKVVPLGALSFNGVVAAGIFKLFGGLFVIALKIAAPVVAAVFLADVVLAILSRIVPQMNVLMVGLPLKIGVGLVGMLIALPISIALSSEALLGIHGQTISLLRLLGGGMR